MRSVAVVLAVIGVLGMILMAVLQVSLWYSFKNNCGDYLKLTGDAPTVERAHEFLGRAIQYLENNGRTSGNSAYFFHTPQNDVGIWYGQIKGAYNTASDLLKRMEVAPGSVSQLERDNALMKIREVVLDQGEKGISVTAPLHITVFPNQWAFLIGWIVSLILLGIGVLILLVFQY